MGAMAGISMGTSLLGGAGNLASSLKAASAIRKSAATQTKAIKEIQKTTARDLDPALLQEKALAADQVRARNQQALMAEIFPGLAAAQTGAQAKLGEFTSQLGQSDSDRLAAVAAAEAEKPTPGLQAGKEALIKAALKDLQAGATLPPELQAELMQSGLQQSSAVTGGAAGSGPKGGGAASSILSRVLGSAGINLQQQRQAQAAQLLSSAGNLDAQRQQILQGLFPRLQQQQMGNLSAASGVFALGQNAAPQAGMSGSQTVSSWLARVGALNQLSTQMYQTKANNYLAEQAAKASAWGSVVSAGQGGGGQTGYQLSGYQQPNTGGGAGGGGSDMVSGIARFFNTPKAAPAITDSPPSGMITSLQ